MQLAAHAENNEPEDPDISQIILEFASKVTTIGHEELLLINCLLVMSKIYNNKDAERYLKDWGINI